MTEDDRKKNIAEAVARAEQALRSAETLAAASLCADAVSRAYYAAFHFVCALLFARGLEPRSHAGGIHLLNQEFVRAGLLPTAVNRVLAALQRTRELADYDQAVTFGPEDARAQIDSARAFGEQALAILRKEGWIS